MFRKTRDRETAEVDRAQAALKTCQAESHRVHDTYTRDIEEGELE
jgi:hypothetical protein